MTKLKPRLSLVGIGVFAVLLLAVAPLLLTDHWLGYGELLRTSISAADLVRWTLLHLAYAAIFLSLAWSRMTTKDVSS
jgi:hypothetical protein